MRRNTIALGLGLLALALLSWNLAVRLPGVNPSEAAAPLEVAAAPPPTPLPDDRSAAADTEEQLFINLY